MILIGLLNIVAIIPTALSLTGKGSWWYRIFDFPRVQLTILYLLNLFLAVRFYSFESVWQLVLVLGLLLCLSIQLYKIYPYTIFSKKQVQDYTSTEVLNPISILVSNVLTSNRNYKKLLDLVADQNPDLILTLETDKKWERNLSSLDRRYPHTVKIPDDNLYGMHLYSKLPLLNTKIEYLIKEGVPSIHGLVQLQNGVKVRLHCLHPRPPSPTESSTSINRDAELQLIAQRVRENELPTIVIGDFNDVGWSATTTLFQKVSGLLDPRQGRGFFNTYHSGYRFFRWPLDHVFHSPHFSLIALSRGAHIGSDHFPMYAKLNYNTSNLNSAEKPRPNINHLHKSEDKILKSKERTA